MLVNVFAVDPGTTTGWAYIRDADPRTIPAGECDFTIVTDQISGDEYQQAHDLYAIIDHIWPCAVVFEDFVPRMVNKQRWFLSPVRIANMTAMLMWEDKRSWCWQQPALAMTTIDDDRLKATGQYIKARPHAMDATRHALTLIRRISAKPKMYSNLIEPRGLEPMGQIDVGK
jgi:hypothetical protein